MKNKRRSSQRSSLFSVERYILIFVFSVIIISICIFIYEKGGPFAQIFRDHDSARFFFSVSVLGAIYTLVDYIRRKIVVERPLKRLTKATDAITHGDYNVHIEPVDGLRGRNEFDDLINSFNMMADQLYESQSVEDDFISNVSHELKTPLAVIQNYATMLQSDSLSDEKRREYAHIIIDYSNKLSALITNILNLNKLENHEMYSKKALFNLSEQLCTSILNFELVWEEKEINLETEIDEDVFVYSDEELLPLVWNNLLSNAMKFTDKGGTVKISLKKDKQYAYVSISDTGCGIDPEDGQRIFDKFFQCDKSHAMGGNGLGLALVKKVIRIVDGDITVTSEPGKGTDFTVKISLLGNNT
ncbi:MAG: HAMP domain-containing sensor histidine kinase [Clostridia bacterium]|nr:HAMP domain-containing sensor histidine kinase [Clostridia bacterium]